MENKFFRFIQPYLSFIDNGKLYRKPFSWLYALLAIINLLVPLYVFYQAADNKIFDFQAKYIIVFLLVWIIIAFASWISFQLWWDRKSKVITTSSEGDEFVATPVFSHLIQTIGEWLGTWLGIVGFSVALLTNLILGDEGYYFSGLIGLPNITSGFISVIAMPVLGFFIIVSARFIAEQLRALSCIANNTKNTHRISEDNDSNPISYSGNKINNTTSVRDDESNPTPSLENKIRNQTSADKLKKYNEMLNQGLITKGDFDKIKKEILKD